VPVWNNRVGPAYTRLRRDYTATNSPLCATCGTCGARTQLSKVLFLTAVVCPGCGEPLFAAGLVEALRFTLKSGGEGAIEEYAKRARMWGR
jgi:hypothetical protein